MNRKQFVIVAVGMIVAAFAGGLVGNLTAMRAAGAADPEGRFTKLTTNALVITSPNGRMRGLFAATDSAVYLSLLNEKGKFAIHAEVAYDGKRGIAIVDEKQQERISLMMNGKDNVIIIRDEKGQLAWTAPRP